MLLMAAGLGFTSCSPEEDDLFGASAAQRLNKSVSYYHNLLQSSEHGWAMEYFVEPEMEMGGYVYTAKFDVDNVSLSSEMPFESEEGEDVEPGSLHDSKYSVKAEQGVILTFDTYNPIFHVFSEPQGNNNTAGLGGDYEFVFMKASANEDTIYLRGKKYDTEVRLVRLQEAHDVYISSVLAKENIVNSASYRKMTVDGKDYPVSFTSDNTLSLTNVDTGKDTLVAYVYTDKGLRFYQPVTINGRQYQDFVLDMETMNLTSVDGTAVVPLPSVFEQIAQPSSPWLFQANATAHDMSDGLYTLFWAANSFSTSYRFQHASLGLPTQDADIKKGFDHVISFYWSYQFMTYNIANYANYGVKLSLDDEAASIYSITGLGEGYLYSGGKKTKVDPFIAALLAASPYKVTFNPEPVKSEITFTSVADNTVWFTLRHDPLQ